MIDPDIEWISVDPSESPGTRACSILADRFADGYRVEIERCVGIETTSPSRSGSPERSAMRRRPAAADAPLLHRRPVRAVVTVRDGRVCRVQEYPPRGRARGRRPRRRGIDRAGMVGGSPPSLEQRRDVPLPVLQPPAPRDERPRADRAGARTGVATPTRSAWARPEGGPVPHVRRLAHRAARERTSVPTAVAPIVSRPCALVSSPAAATARG
jgi:hypothetical protein